MKFSSRDETWKYFKENGGAYGLDTRNHVLRLWKDYGFIGTLAEVKKEMVVAGHLSRGCRYKKITDAKRAPTIISENIVFRMDPARIACGVDQNLVLKKNNRSTIIGCIFKECKLLFVFFRNSGWRCIRAWLHKR